MKNLSLRNSFSPKMSNKCPFLKGGRGGHLFKGGAYLIISPIGWALIQLGRLFDGGACSMGALIRFTMIVLLKC